MFSNIPGRPPTAMHVHITQITVWSRELPRKLKAEVLRGSRYLIQVTVAPFIKFFRALSPPRAAFVAWAKQESFCSVKTQNALAAMTKGLPPNFCSMAELKGRRGSLALLFIFLSWQMFQ